MNDSEEKFPFINIINSSITTLSLKEQGHIILQLALNSCGHFVCIANTNMLALAKINSAFRIILQSADLIIPGEMSVVWMMNFIGRQPSDRVAGIDLFLHLCKQASEQLIPVFFVGSQSSILDKMGSKLSLDFPKLEVAGMEPLPFGQTRDKDEALIKKINKSGAKLVFVSLGCPKQEIWMASHKHEINAVMIGLEGVFHVYSGPQKYAPEAFRNAGLVWLYRLLQESRRLCERCASSMPVYLALALYKIYPESSIAPTSSSEKIKQSLPEEWISDLESLKTRLLKLNIPERKVKRRIFFVLLTMLLTKIRINIENIWLSSEWNSKKTK
jgi:N-acetylglucosaminyldiphosphoundecaprenol N-acetyl-beta-D-mannosaminyltransferase